MTQQDAGIILAIAAMAASADGQQDSDELAQINAAADRLGLSGAANQLRQAAAGQLDLGLLAAQLSDGEARKAAFDISAAVCNASGPANESENAFLGQLAQKLGLATPEAAFATDASNISNAPFPSSPSGIGAATASAATATAGAVTSNPATAFNATSSAATPADLNQLILDQAMLTAALEILPDRLANMAILPLQLRLVYTIGQRHGQQMNAAQAKDLAATFGIGAVAQVMEGVVRKVFGGVAGGLLGGLLGGAAGMAAGASVTFASTYALGHAAERYYAQNRTLSVTDMKTLFTELKGEAATMYPRVQDRIQSLAGRTNLQSVMQSLRR